jgi:hypothetical protein
MKIAKIPTIAMHIRPPEVTEKDKLVTLAMLVLRTFSVFGD